MPQLEIAIGAQTFKATLYEKAAPNTCKLFSSSLPLKTTVYHSAWSGDSIFFIVPRGKFSSLPAKENTSIYGSRGDIMWHPGEEGQEFQIVHGVAQFRWKVGPLESNIFAKIDDKLGEFDELCRAIQKGGGRETTISLKQSYS